jgi:hypothetical protein
MPGTPPGAAVKGSAAEVAALQTCLEMSEILEGV